MTLEQSFLRYREHGDVAALGAVFDAVAQELALVAAHLAPPGVEPEDLVQATFVAAIEHPHRWDRNRPLTPWLIGILVNHARRERQRTQRVVPEHLTGPAAPDPLDVVELHEVGTRIAEALHGLPRHYRQALTLRLLHGLQPAQIATALGCPVATCKTRLQRGLDLLRRALPAGLATSLAVLLSPGKGLAICREVVLAKAAAVSAAASVASVSVITGVVMKKTAAIVGVLALVATALVFWSPAASDAPQEAPSTTPLAAAVSTVSPATIPTKPQAVAIAAGDRTEPLRTDDTAAIRGRVVDAAGLGLPDVAVALGRASPNSEFSDVASFVMHRSHHQPPDVPPERAAQTDADGRFAFPVALREQGSVLTAWSEIRGAVLHPLPEDLAQELRGELVLVLPDHGQISGRVIGDDGRPLPGVDVSVYPARSGMPAAWSKSDADGLYRIVPLPPGPYRACAQSPQHAWAETAVELGSGDVEADLRLPLLPVLSARLVDPRQEPWTGVRLENELGVNLARFDVLVTQDSCQRRAEAARGGFELTRLHYDPADARVDGAIRDRNVHFVSLWWGEARLAEVPLASLAQQTIEVAPIRPALQVLHVRLAFAPHPTRPVRTTIRLDRPARIAVQLENELTVTTEGFEARLSVPASNVATAWWLSVHAEGYAPYDEPLAWPTGSDLLVQDVRLEHSSRCVHGIVFGPDGAPLERANVLLLAADGNFVGRRQQVSSTTDRDGAFRCEHLPNRPLRLLVDAGSRGMAAVDVPLDATLPLRVIATTPQLFAVEGADSNGSQLRVLDPVGHTILDDRLSGTVRYGRLQLHAPGEPHHVEAFVPGSPLPHAQGGRQGETNTFVLTPTAK